MDEEIKNIKQQFFMLRNGVIADTLRKAGLPYDMSFGVNIIQLREMAQTIDHNMELAEKLWTDKRCRESMLLAPMIYPVDCLTVPRAIEMLEDCPTVEVSDILCHSLLRHLPQAWDIIDCVNPKDDMARYGAVRLAFNLYFANPQQAKAVAENELGKNCSLTKNLCQKLIDEINYLNEE